MDKEPLDISAVQNNLGRAGIHIGNITFHGDVVMGKTVPSTAEPAPAQEERRWKVEPSPTPPAEQVAEPPIEGKFEKIEPSQLPPSAAEVERKAAQAAIQAKVRAEQELRRKEQATDQIVIDVLGQHVSSQVRAVLTQRNQAAAALMAELSAVQRSMEPAASFGHAETARDTYRYRLVKEDIKTLAVLAQKGRTTPEKSVTVDLLSLDPKTGEPRISYRVTATYAAHDNMSAELYPCDKTGQPISDSRSWLNVTPSKFRDPDGSLKTGGNRDSEPSPASATEWANCLREAVKQQARFASA